MISLEQLRNFVTQGEFALYLHKISGENIGSILHDGNGTESLTEAYRAWVKLSLTLGGGFNNVISNLHTIVARRLNNAAWSSEAREPALTALNRYIDWLTHAYTAIIRTEQNMANMGQAYTDASQQAHAQSCFKSNREMAKNLKENQDLAAIKKATELDAEYQRMREENIEIMLEYANRILAAASNLPAFKEPPAFEFPIARTVKRAHNSGTLDQAANSSPDAPDRHKIRSPRPPTHRAGRAESGRSAHHR